VFLRFYNAVKDLPFLAQRINATGRLQAHPLQKVVAAFRVIAYGEAPYRTDEYVRLSASPIAMSVRELMRFIVDEFGPAYLRCPTPEELQRILTRNAERGMPGCIGSLNCSHWEWRNCPKAFAGMQQNRHGKRSVVTDTVCHEDLWIWHLFVGCPGSHNDVNVMHVSPLYLSFTNGEWPPRTFSFTANGTTRTRLYFLVGGTFPRFAFFVSPFPNPTTEIEVTLNRLQETLRKDVERLYAVLTSRFHVALHPARYASVAQMVTFTEAVAILHNMVTEKRRDGYVSRTRMAAGSPAAGGCGVEELVQGGRGAVVRGSAAVTAAGGQTAGGGGLARPSLGGGGAGTGGSAAATTAGGQAAGGGGLAGPGQGGGGAGAGGSAAAATTGGPAAGGSGLAGPGLGGRGAGAGRSAVPATPGGQAAGGGNLEGPGQGGGGVAVGGFLSAAAAAGVAAGGGGVGALPAAAAAGGQTAGGGGLEGPGLGGWGAGAGESAATVTTGSQAAGGNLLPPPPRAVRRPAAAASRDLVRVVGKLGPGDLLPPPPPAVRRPAAADWRDRVWVVAELGRGDLLSPPQPAVRRPAAATLRDRDRVGEGWQLEDFCLPPRPPAWPPAAAVSVHFPLPPPPAVRWPAAAAWRDRDLVVGVGCVP